MTPMEPINTDKTIDEDDDGMRDQYDFSNAVRGNHAAAYVKGIEVRVDGAPRVVMVALDPDVADTFPNSQAVNEALRHVIKTSKSVRERAKLNDEDVRAELFRGA